MSRHSNRLGNQEAGDMSETSADELDGDRPEFGEAPNLVEIRCQWQSRSFVESGLPFLGQDSYVMNIMATLHSVSIIVFGLLDTIYWLKKPQFHASDLSGMPVNLVNYRSLFSLVTCIRRAFNQYLNRELVMVTTKSGFVHLFEYQDENLVELAEIRNSGLGDDISIWSVALLRSRPILAASSNTKLIELIDLTNITEPRSIDFLSGHDHNIPSIDISDDDQLLISASIDGSSRIWHIASRTLIYSCVESPDVWGWAAMFFPVDYSSNASLYDSNNVDFNERFDQLQRWTQV